MWYAIFIAAYTNEFFYMIIPGSNIFIAYRPINSMTIFGVGSKIKITPAVTGPCP
jgi:hypothetical protein